jgi:hypothetical protein
MAAVAHDRIDSSTEAGRAFLSALRLALEGQTSKDRDLGAHLASPHTHAAWAGVGLRGLAALDDVVRLPEHTATYAAIL